MSKISSVVSFILSKSNSIEVKNVEQRVIKLQEETGELAAAILMNAGLKNTTKTKKQIVDNVLEEGSDVIIITLSILAGMGFTKKQVEKMMSAKLTKWTRVNTKKSKNIK